MGCAEAWLSCAMLMVPVGKNDGFIGLEKKHARLAVTTAGAIAAFVLECDLKSGVDQRSRCPKPWPHHEVVARAAENTEPHARHARYGSLPRCPNAMPGPSHTGQDSYSSDSSFTQLPLRQGSR